MIKSFSNVHLMAQYVSVNILLCLKHEYYTKKKYIIPLNVVIVESFTKM